MKDADLRQLQSDVEDIYKKLDVLQRWFVHSDSVSTVTRKRIIAPIIEDFTYAQHTHVGSGGGGEIAEASLSLSDVTTNNASSARHGFCPKLSDNPSQFLRGDGAWADPHGSIAGTAARAYRSTSDQTLSSGAWRQVEFNAESYDIGNNYSLSTYTYTVPENGIYLVVASIAITNTQVSEYNVGLFVNSNLVAKGILRLTNTNVSYVYTPSVHDIVNVSANDSISVYALCNSYNITVVADSTASYLSVCRIA